MPTKGKPKKTTIAGETNADKQKRQTSSPELRGLVGFFLRFSAEVHVNFPRCFSFIGFGAPNHWPHHIDWHQIGQNDYERGGKTSPEILTI